MKSVQNQHWRIQNILSGWWRYRSHHTLLIAKQYRWIIEQLASLLIDGYQVLKPATIDANVICCVATLWAQIGSSIVCSWIAFSRQICLRAIRPRTKNGKRACFGTSHMTQRFEGSAKCTSDVSWIHYHRCGCRLNLFEIPIAAMSVSISV